MIKSRMLGSKGISQSIGSYNTKSGGMTHARVPENINEYNDTPSTKNSNMHGQNFKLKRPQSSSVRVSYKPFH